MLVRPAAGAAAAAALSLVLSVAPAAGAADTGDPHAHRQFGLDQVRAPAAWPVSTGAGAVVAVVDSGVDLDHPDLDAQLLPGATFLACGSAGPCGDGDWQSGPPSRQDTASTHGTHVAGIVAAETGNGLGVAGVAPAARILPVKVLDDDGGSFADIAAGIRYAVAQGADVVNLSLGALPGVQALTVTGLVSDVQAAISDARRSGVVVVAAAGNDVASPVCSTPAFDRGALCVAATDKRQARAAYSNLAVNQELDTVAAPGGSLLPVCGEDVVSTVPVGTGPGGCGYGADHDELAGTSMAAPHVSGVAALLAAQGRDDDEIVDVLLRTSRQPLTDVRGAFTPAYGWGIVDAAAAVREPVVTAPAGSPAPSPTTSPATSPSPSPTASPAAESSPSPEVSPSPTATATPTATASVDDEPAPAPQRADGVTRLAGDDRFGTAAAVSRDGFPGTVDEVVVVTGTSWPDALTAGPAAASLDAPVLPVRAGAVPAVIGDELDRLQPRRAWVVGGAGAVGSAVVADLEARGIAVTRVSGADRYATAAAVAARFFPDAAGAYYVSGAEYADALGAGAAAAHRGWPLLLTARDTVPATTPRVGSARIVLGGEAAVSERVRAELGARRVAGRDRYATAAAAALDAFAQADVLHLATGLDFPDALAGAPVAARDRAPLLLAARTCVTQATRDAATALGARSRVVLGGTAVVSDEAADLRLC